MKFLPIFVAFLVVFANIRVNAQRKVICYFRNYVAPFRPAPTTFLPSNINGTLCTHIVYRYAILDPVALTIQPADPPNDITGQFYQQVNAFRSQGIGVLIALGFSDSGTKYSTLMATAASRNTFIQSVITFLQTYNFNGIELDFRYPSCWGGTCAESADKANFALLIQGLSAALKPLQFLLSAAVSLNSGTSYYAYNNIPVMSQYLDWISLLTVSYHSSVDGMTGLNAPLFSYDGYNVDGTVKYWIQAGAARSKLIVAIQAYARTFTLVSEFKHGLGASTSGPGTAGVSGNSGEITFFEVLNYVNNQGYTYMRDAASGNSPYAYWFKQWIAFDDVDTVRSKATYINAANLGGAAMLTLDNDDFNNFGGCAKYPILTTINQVLRNTGGPLVPKCFNH